MKINLLKYHFLSTLLSAVLLVTAVNCTRTSEATNPDTDPIHDTGKCSKPQKSDRFSVMSYNVENLFDTTHDEGKKDWTYLPKAFKDKSEEVQKYCRSLRNQWYRKSCFDLDWTQKVLDQKIENIAKMIKSSGSNGCAPDVISFQEVENIHVLKELVNKGLADQGYKEIVLIEGPDNRGIDVAFVSRFPLARPAIQHDVELSWTDGSGKKRTRKTRGILEARFTIGHYEDEVTFLSNHWPSQASPSKTRVQAAEKMHKISEAITDTPVISLGDFNTIDRDDPHPFETWTKNKRRKIHFEDAHEENTDEDLHPGSHWYRGTWSFLDHIFFLVEKSNAEVRPDTITPDWDSFFVHAPEFALHDIHQADGRTYKDIPWRFDPNTGEGFSDHLPLVMEFIILDENR